MVFENNGWIVAVAGHAESLVKLGAVALSLTKTTVFRDRRPLSVPREKLVLAGSSAEGGDDPKDDPKPDAEEKPG